MRIAVCLLVCLLCPALRGEAGQRPATPAAVGGTGLPAGVPSAPIAPATINRDSMGKATVRAVRVTGGLRIDGRLDEAIYSDVPPLSDFIQNDPKEGAPASEKTDAWILFDDDNVYVVARCWESRPEAIIGREMRRDNVGLVQDDQFAWSFDTFYDKRNVVLFEVSVTGGKIDGQVTNERQVSLDWNPIWDVKTTRFEGGYIVEAAIPFKSLRYAPGADQVWGVQLRRHNMAKNEYSFLTPIPASIGSQGHFRAALAATMVGLVAPRRSARNLDIKPYARADLSTDRTARPVVDNDPGGDVGVDVKYGLTQSLAADFTVNTDFAQVEADEQQVNLTRFNLFFPEKREFFLENGGLFSFGNSSQGGGGDTPQLFYSRAIGLHQGREVPILAGARLSGRAGRFTIGALNVQSDDEVVSGARATNFTVVRVKRDVLRNSSIGMIATNRSLGTAAGTGANQSYGADGAFLFGPELVAGVYWAQSRTDGAANSDNVSYRANVDYAADRYGLSVDHLRVEPGFDPQIGFVRRRDMQKNYVQGRFSPRPKNAKTIRKYSFQGTFNNIENTAGRLESRSTEGRFGIDLQNGDSFALSATDSFEFLPAPFAIARGVILPIGGYDFANGRVSYTFGRQRKLAGTLAVDYGSFYDGTKTTWQATGGRFNVNQRLSVEPSYTVNQIEVSAGKFTTKLLTTRTTYTMTPLMFVSALLQYNSGSNTFAMNARLRWEYSPGSEFFLVYNDQRDTVVPGFPDLLNRAVVVKINRVFRY